MHAYCAVLLITARVNTPAEFDCLDSLIFGQDKRRVKVAGW
jgi:hypothetical protein